MHEDKKVGIALDVIGTLLLVLSAALNLPIFWPVFGMACVIAGTYKLIVRILVERSEESKER